MDMCPGGMQVREAERFRCGYMPSGYRPEGAARAQASCEWPKVAVCKTVWMLSACCRGEADAYKALMQQLLCCPEPARAGSGLASKQGLFTRCH